MDKRVLFVAVLLSGYSFNAKAQQFTPVDESGEVEYEKACKEFQLVPSRSIAMFNDYLDKYPDSRHRNRVESLIATAYFKEGRYKEAIAIFNSCDIDALADNERDEAAYSLATAYLKENDIEKAKVWFTMLKSISGSHYMDAVYNLAYIDYSEKRYDDAAKAFLSLKDNERFGENSSYYLSEIYLLQKRYQNSLSISKELQEKYPNSKLLSDYYRVEGESYYGMNSFVEAATALQKYILSASQPQRAALYEAGVSLYNTGVYSQAASMFSKAATTSDEISQSSYLYMGLSYLQLKERNMARMSFEQAANYNFNTKIKEEALYNYALLIHETSYSPFAESVTVFERFLNEFPDSEYSDRVNDYLVEVYMNTKSYVAALASINKIKSPGKAIMEAKQKILFSLGTQEFANSDFEKALSYFNQSLSLGNYAESVRLNATYWKGETLYRLERYDQATEEYKRYINSAKDRAGEEYRLALYNLGYCYFKQKNYSQAKGWFEKYASLPKDNALMLADAYNRIGDCNFYSREFAVAATNYSKAKAADSSLADYSLYQEAFVKGLQRDYNGKIVTLNTLLSDYPQSQYIDDAIYEQGRAFVQMEQNNKAIERYNILLQKFPQSAMARKAASEIGLLYYQDDKYPQAIDAYKKVIKEYPGSEEAGLAQRDLKSIYIDLNKVDEYAAFASTLNNGVAFNANERDSLTYAAAEKVYMKGAVDEARRSFINYLQSFPQGAFALDANYYVGLIDFNQKNYNEALSSLDKVLQFPSNKFSENAMLLSATMAFDGGDYQKSLTLYSNLINKTASADKLQKAQIGMLRSAAKLNRCSDIIMAADKLLASAKLSPELSNEARYYRSKAYIQSRELNKALPDLKLLANDTRNVYGAEAKFQLAQIYFEQDNKSAAEKELLNYIEVSTPHVYWLARSFVLLSDIYMQTGRNVEAKQYLLSLKQNYNENQEINSMIESRLSKL